METRARKLPKRYFYANDNNINNIKDLLGKTILFKKDSSTSAFFAPSIHLLEQGFELQKMRSIRDRPDANKIGYSFINDHLRQSNEVK
jgi:phosphonate transport system substrate-binding protein